MSDLTTRSRSRLLNHSLIVVGSVVSLLIVAAMIDSDDWKYKWSMATGYVSIILLALSLLIGPFKVYTKRLNPVSSDLRRDVGIWCGLMGLAHVAIGIQVHMGNIFLYFFKSVQGEEAFKLRSDLFGTANYVGLAATLVLIILLLVSNDISLRLLKSDRWKKIQRWNYFLFVAVLIHGVMYQAIENRLLPIVAIFCIIMILPVIGQVLGFTIKKLEK